MNFDDAQLYDTEYLLNRVYSSFTTDKKQTRLVPPIFEKKDRKSYVHNFLDVCKSINRDPDEIKKYIGRELNMETSFKESGSLKIDGLVRSQNLIENQLIKYVTDYVQCKSCKSCKTNVEKQNRITYLVCETCGARVSFNKDF